MNRNGSDARKRRSGSRWLALLLAAVMIASATSVAWAYNFTFFGGRKGRAGVTTGAAGTNDFLYSWNEPDNGTLTWFFIRGDLTNASCDAACFAALKALIQPELDKWALWIREGFAEAPDSASADIIYRFIDFSAVAGSADASVLANTGTTLDKVLVRIDPDGLYGWGTAQGKADFCFLILHESGHALGLGDLYNVNHGDETFEGEDFCDHGFPTPPLPNPNTKADNVMQTRGIKTLDNDEIHGAEWLWGNSGSNAIVTGELAIRTGSNNANKAAAHHGLTQTPKTWIYRGSVAAFLAAPKVTLFFKGAQAARDVGPGSWTPAIFADRVEFTHTGAYEGNFKFEIDCDQGPEKYGNATVAGAVVTSFTATPAGGGPQLFPFDQPFGSDCTPPVPVLIAGFEARAAADGVSLAWQILADEKIEGYRLYRAAGEATDFHAIGGVQLIAPDVTSYRDREVAPGTTYRYALGVFGEDGKETRSQTVSVSTPAGVLALYQNHPNPFNPSTMISFVLPRDLHVKLSIFNPEGKLVRTLRNEALPAGYHEIRWDGTDADGRPVSTGVYLYRLEGGKDNVTKKMVLLK